MQANCGSFRDPSGQVFVGETEVLRTIRSPYKNDWEHIKKSRLLEEAQKSGFISFQQLPKDKWPAEIVGNDAAMEEILISPRLPFISLPCEWSFSQLKQAALLTIDLHLLALNHGCILKDASAYNVQFLGLKPIFIDLLSFERWKEGQPWQAYGQYCSHFVAPLALMAKTDLRLGLLSELWMDGIPLDLAAKLLPAASRLNPGLAMHIHLHSSMRARHSDGRESAEKIRKSQMGIQQLKDVAASLRNLVSSLKLKNVTTEWGDYYSDTNYTETARQSKMDIVAKLGSKKGRLALDLGANKGDFSRHLAPNYELVLATDYDALAVERNVLNEKLENILPLVLDIARPTPGYGWECKERPSFIDRCKADLLMALALVHHLRFTAGIPFSKMAQGFAQLLIPGGHAIVEFVPKEDSQVTRLLAARDDIFDDYTRENFIKAFEENGFKMLSFLPVAESLREIFLFEKFV